MYIYIYTQILLQAGVQFIGRDPYLFNPFMHDICQGSAIMTLPHIQFKAYFYSFQFFWVLFGYLIMYCFIWMFEWYSNIILMVQTWFMLCCVAQTQIITYITSMIVKISANIIPISLLSKMMVLFCIYLIFEVNSKLSSIITVYLSKQVAVSDSYCMNDFFDFEHLIEININFNVMFVTTLYFMTTTNNSYRVISNEHNNCWIYWLRALRYVFNTIRIIFIVVISIFANEELKICIIQAIISYHLYLVLEDKIIDKIFVCIAFVVMKSVALGSTGCDDNATILISKQQHNLYRSKRVTYMPLQKYLNSGRNATKVYTLTVGRRSGVVTTKCANINCIDAERHSDHCCNCCTTIKDAEFDVSFDLWTFAVCITLAHITIIWNDIAFLSILDLVSHCMATFMLAVILRPLVTVIPIFPIVALVTSISKTQVSYTEFEYQMP